MFDGINILAPYTSTQICCYNKSIVCRHKVTAFKTYAWYIVSELYQVLWCDTKHLILDLVGFYALNFRTSHKKIYGVFFYDSVVYCAFNKKKFVEKVKIFVELCRFEMSTMLSFTRTLTFARRISVFLL